jgi:holo-[acyl-carrier protein] synthase
LGEVVVVGSGIDVIEIARVERALSRSGHRFAQRVFTPREIEACQARRRPALHFSLRFAAKEAVMKAVGTGWAQGVRWLDIEVVPADASAPDPAALSLALRGKVAELAARSGGTRSHLAVARSRTHALAVVLLEGEPS